jgi:metallophosphoesterase (TIGR00282 family)
MKILYIGDVMGNTGIEVVEQILLKLRQDRKIDLVIAQAENVTDGKGITPADFRRLRAAGVDFCTGGNWSLHRQEIIPLLDNQAEPIIRPANYPIGTPGRGYKYIRNNDKVTLVISLLGHIVGKDSDKPIDNPLRRIDDILRANSSKDHDAIVVNFHGDYSSEKVVIGHYLDGRVTAVIGDHWHVPTADARVLLGGTAHITDVGMCGVLDASLGVTYQSVIPRWRDDKQTRNILETSGLRQFNAVLLNTNRQGLADSIEQIQQVLDIPDSSD